MQKKVNYFVCSYDEKPFRVYGIKNCYEPALNDPRCASHLDQWMIVLARHSTTLSDLEKNHIDSVLENYFDDKYQLRDEASILDHWHKHIIELD